MKFRRSKHVAYSRSFLSYFIMKRVFASRQTRLLQYHKSCRRSPLSSAASRSSRCLSSMVTLSRFFPLTKFSSLTRNFNRFGPFTVVGPSESSTQHMIPMTARIQYSLCLLKKLGIASFWGGIRDMECQHNHDIASAIKSCACSFLNVALSCSSFIFLLDICMKLIR